MAEKTLIFDVKIQGADEQIQKLAELEKEMERVKKATKKAKEAGGDYHKEVAKNNVALKELRERHRNVNKEVTKTIQENKKHSGSIVEMRKQLTAQRQKYDELSAAQRNNAKVGGRMLKNIKSLDNSLTKLEGATGRAQRGVGRYYQSIKRVTMQLLGGFGLIAGLRLLSRTIIKGFGTLRVYQKANAELAAILGKTVSETNALQDASKLLGGTTAFTATEVVNLQIALARLGKTEEEIIASTEGIIDATIALGSETGETAALVGATLNSFKKGAAESSQVADILTLSTQRSALSFEKLNTALPIAGAAAASAGISLERTVALLGQAADRGIDASTAATSLRNIFIKLAEKGLTLEQALYKINTSHDKLTTSVDLFGVRAAVTGIALAETTDKTNELTTALENAGGTAKRVAEQQLDTLDGKIKLFKSAWEQLVLSMLKAQQVEGFLGGVTAALNNWVNSAKSARVQANEFSQTLITKIGQSSDTAAEKLKRYNRVLEEEKKQLALNIKEQEEYAESTKTNIFKNITKQKEEQRIRLKEEEKLKLIIANLERETLKLTKDIQIEEIRTASLQEKSLAELIRLQTNYNEHREHLTDNQQTYLAALQAEIALRNTLLQQVTPEEAEQEEFKKNALGSIDDTPIEQLRTQIDKEIEVIQEGLDKKSTILQRDREQEQALRDLAAHIEIEATKRVAEKKLTILGAVENAILGLLGDSLAARLAAVVIQGLTEIATIAITTKAAQAKNLAQATASAPPPANFFNIGIAGVQNAVMGANSAAAISGVIAASAIKGGLSLIPRKKPVKVRFAKGGVLKGASHSEGGIYMGGGVEAEGGEPILTKSVTKDRQDMQILSAINEKHGGVPLTNYKNGTYKFAKGGLIPNNENIQLTQIAQSLSDLKVTLNVHEVSNAISNIELLESEGRF